MPVTTHEPPTILLVIVCLIAAPFSYYWITVAPSQETGASIQVKRTVVGETIFLLTAFILVKNGSSRIRPSSSA
jgi:hypothetical protein